MNLSPGLATFAVAFVLGYIPGSIPFGFLLTRAAGLGDVRDIGSGNIGATNVLRTGRKSIAAATLLFDVAKGAAAVLIVGGFFGQTAAVCAGLGAFLGHVFPVWLNFKGGKGVATYLGVLIGLVWQAAAVFVLVWIVVAATSRVSSLAAMIASVAAPIAVYAWGSQGFAAAAAFMAAVILIKHRSNICRLLAGKEPRIGAEA